MWCTPSKQGTSDILGKMNFWYNCKEHTNKSSSNSSYFLKYNHFCISVLSGSVIWRHQPLNFPIPNVRIWQAAENAEFFVGKCLKINQKSHGGERKHIKVHKKKNRQMSYFSPLCQLQLPISQNRHVRLVPWFVEVHHIHNIQTSPSSNFPPLLLFCINVLLLYE